MNIIIELSNEDIKRIIVDELQKRLGETPLDKSAITIEVKSSKNYRAEWELGQFKVTYKRNI